MHNSCAHYYHTRVITGALQYPIIVSGPDRLISRHYLYSVSSYLLSLWSPYVQSNTILYHRLATQSAYLLFLFFHWLWSTHSCHLHLDAGYQLFRILSALIDFYLITFGTHIDIAPAFLSLILARSWCPFSTYSHFLSNISLRVSCYYKNLHTTLE